MKARLIKEIWMHSLTKKGYRRATASKWYNRVKKDNRLWKDTYSKATLKAVHKKGFLAKNIENLDLLGAKECTRISDLDYLSLGNMNNNFVKWVNDLNTLNRMFPQHRDCLSKIYYTFFFRETKTCIAEFPMANGKVEIADLVAFLKENKDKEFNYRPAYWINKGERHVVQYCDDNNILVDQTALNFEQFVEFIDKKQSHHILCDKVDYNYRFDEEWHRRSDVKFYITNDKEGQDKILCTIIDQVANEKQFSVGKDGKFTTDKGIEVQIPNWDKITEKIIAFADDLKQLRFFSVTVILKQDGFYIDNISTAPSLPEINCTEELNTYLLEQLAKRKQNVMTYGQKKTAFKNKLFKKFVKKFCRPGIRPYMQRLWLSSVKDDFKYKETSLRQKVWAWRRGFLSYRIAQYGLTEENYKKFLSDYDYHWLNRINGVFQGWINDKTTYRYIMEPVKELVPEYYFSVYQKDGDTLLAKMQDCPKGIEATFDGVIELLEQKKKLVFKPSAGTHGDGFYCFEYEDGTYMVNSEPKTKEELVEVITSQKSFYIITDYIVMHSKLKKIYPKSVDSIRIMVVNSNGYDPRILQAYLRIGSSKTGFTDNIGYGGICSMVNLENGELYNPQTVKDHVFYPCEHHPDTGTKISGVVIPHWELICESVKKISRLMPELEYLGFDVAVTEDGLNIMEINIHQDLHKVGEHSEEIRQFFRDKIAYKKRLLSIK